MDKTYSKNCYCGGKGTVKWRSTIAYRGWHVECIKCALLMVLPNANRETAMAVWCELQRILKLKRDAKLRRRRVKAAKKIEKRRRTIR